MTEEGIRGTFCDLEFLQGLSGGLHLTKKKDKERDRVFRWKVWQGGWGVFLKRDTWVTGDSKQASWGFELSWLPAREQLESLMWGCLSRSQLTKCAAYSSNVLGCFLFISCILMERNFKSLFRGIRHEACQLCARWRSCKATLDWEEYTRERNLKSWER